MKAYLKQNGKAKGSHSWGDKLPKHLKRKLKKSARQANKKVCSN